MNTVQDVMELDSKIQEKNANVVYIKLQKKLA